MSKRDYYDILGVDKSADAKTLKSAFRKKAMDCHPDRHPDDPDAEARFKELNEAYGVLSDEQKRPAYDRMGHAAFSQGGGAGGRGQQGFGGFEDIFSQIFGGSAGGFGGARTQQAARGSDLRYEIEVSLEASFAGKEMEISVPVSEECHGCDGSGAAPGATVESCPTCAGHGRVRTQQGFFQMERPCPKCGGQGEYVSDPCKTCDGTTQVRVESNLTVTIPAGVEDGTRIRLTGEGDAAPKGAGQRGDLYLFVHIKPHELFEREGANLFCAAPLPMTTAALGGDVEIPTIDGGRAKVKIPAGAQTGQRMRLRGKGMSVLRSSQRGDMYVELNVETPSKLNSRQRELLEEFAKEGGDSVSPQSASFLDKAKRFWDELRD